MDIEIIREKIKDSHSMAMTKKLLTPAELVTVLKSDTPDDESFSDDDAMLIAQILQMVSEKNYSVRHAWFLMETCKNMIPAIATFQI